MAYWATHPTGLPMIEALGSDDIFIQTGAANALAEIGKPAIPRLVAELGNPKSGQRAAEILKELHWQPSMEQEKNNFNNVPRNPQPVSFNLPDNQPFDASRLPNS